MGKAPPRLLMINGTKRDSAEFTDSNAGKEKRGSPYRPKNEKY